MPDQPRPRADHRRVFGQRNGRAPDSEGARTKVVRMVARDEALYLEALLEKRLGIKDRPVPGELGSDRDPLP